MIIPVCMVLLSIVGAGRLPLISVGNQGIVLSFGSHRSNKVGTHHPTVVGGHQLNVMLQCVEGNHIGCGERSGWETCMHSNSCLQGCRV